MYRNPYCAATQALKMLLVLMLAFLTQVPAVPPTVAIHGMLQNAQKAPITGTFAYRLEFFNLASGGASLGGPLQGNATLNSLGQFSISLTPPAGLLASSEAWYELYLDTDNNGIDSADKFSQRMKVESVPFARVADTAGSVNWPNITNIPSGFADGVDDIATSLNWSSVAGKPSGFADNVDNTGYTHIYNVKDYGATGNGSTDDTAACQAAINTAKTNGGTVLFPPGSYSLRSLNLTNITRSLVVLGCGINTTWLMPNTDNVNFLDLTGSAFIQLRNFQIGAYNQVKKPKTAILMAQAGSSFVSNAFHFESLFVAGSYTVATVYCYGVPSSDMIDCDFYNYQPNLSNGAVVFFTYDNVAGITSEFTTINPTGSNTSDWTLNACEIHDLSKSVGTPLMPSLRLHNTAQMRWIGGNISGEGPALIAITGGFTGGNSCISFIGTTLYSELGAPGANTIKVESFVNGLSLIQCLVQASTSIFGGNSGAVYDSLHYEGKAGQFSSAPYIFNVPSGILRNSILYCDSKQLLAGSISSSTMLLRPGAISGSNNALVLP